MRELILILKFLKTLYSICIIAKAKIAYTIFLLIFNILYYLNILWVIFFVSKNFVIRKKHKLTLYAYTDLLERYNEFSGSIVFFSNYFLRTLEMQKSNYKYYYAAIIKLLWSSSNTLCYGLKYSFLICFCN